MRKPAVSLVNQGGVDGVVEQALNRPKAGLGMPGASLAPTGHGPGIAQVYDTALFVVPTVLDRDAQESVAHIEHLKVKMAEWAKDRKKPYGNRDAIQAESTGPDLTPPFTITSGRHRFLAAAALGLKVKAEIVPKLSAEQSVKDELSENVDRLNLNSYHLVMRAGELTGKFPDKTHEELAGWLNVSTRQFRYYLRVFKHPDLLEDVRKGALSIKEANEKIRVTHEVALDGDEFLGTPGGKPAATGTGEGNAPGAETPALRFFEPTEKKHRMAFVLDLDRASKKEKVKALEVLTRLHEALNGELNPNDKRSKDRREKRDPSTPAKRRSVDKG